MSISRDFEKMILLVILLGSMTLGSAVENSTSDSGVVIDANKKLVSITEPSIDIDLSGLDLLSLDSDAFANCVSAKALDLSNNSIKKLPKGVFAPLKNLERLSLAKNDLGGKTLKRAFLGLANLKSLNITYNPLSRILQNETFVGLTNSCEIYVGISRGISGYLGISRDIQNFRTITPLAFGKVNKPELKNHTLATEVKVCPDHLDDRIEIEETRKVIHEPFSDAGVKMCTDRMTVRLVDFSNVTDTLSPNCRSILINYNGTKLRIDDGTITSFETGWFRIRNTSVTAICLFPGTFENVTSDLLNDLPENIRFFSLRHSELKRLHKGVMFNEHLRHLDLSDNRLSFIEENTFAGLNLNRLNLRFNYLTILDYVLTLPETLLWLNLQENYISEIPVDSFSHLKNLLSLNLAANLFTELVPGTFRGLASLQVLDLSLGKITNLRRNVFQNLSRLYYMNLAFGKVSLLEKGAFNGLGCLTELDLGVNHLKKIDEGTFDGLTDSLKAMHLYANELETLQAGSFVGAPKFNLSLKENKIRKIEKGTFDLPYLNNLDLHTNDLRTIEKGALQNVGYLSDKIEIRLGFNKITRLENGALGGLPSNAYVSFTGNPIEVIQAGVFDDL